MRLIRACSACSGPVTIKMARCPHCAARHPAGIVARAVSAAAVLFSGVTVSSTLAACYGVTCANPGDDDCPDYVPRCSEVVADAAKEDSDGDGYCKLQDCDERDPKINARARDIPNDGIDQNCDGKDSKQ